MIQISCRRSLPPHQQSSHNGPIFSPLFPLWSLPFVIPSFGSGVIRLHAAVLDGEHISKDTLLVHRFAEHSASITSANPQLLTRRLHALILALQFKFLLTALLCLEQLPGAVDGPVAQVAVSGEAERARGERMVEEVADESCVNC